MSQLLDQHPRMTGHTKGLELMRRDDFLNALSVLKKTFLAHEGHILLVVDLASCYYMLNDYQNFKKWTLIGFEQYKSNFTKFTQSTQLRAVLGLGKLLEEMGWVDEAVKLYQNGLRLGYNSDETSKKNSNFIRIEAQTLRLLAELSLFSEVPELYVRCEQYKIFDNDIDFEIQIALMLCDFHLTGIHSSHSRLKRILQNENYTQSDRRLAFFNFLYELLRLKVDHFQFETVLLDKYPYFECDSFEKCLLDIWMTDIGKTPMEPIDCRRSEQLSFLSGVRFLTLIEMRPHLDPLREASKKNLLYLQTISIQSRNLLFKQWPLFQTSKSIEISLSKKELFVDSLVVNCTASTLSTLALFTKVKKRGTSECIQALFGLDLSDSTFDRLRMSVKRINIAIGAKLGIKNLLIMTKQEIFLHSAVSVSLID